MPTATLTRNEICFLAAVRIVMPQYRTATDNFLAGKFEKGRLHSCVEEVEIFLESFNCDLHNQVLTIELMASILKCLTQFIENVLYLSSTPKSVADCISYLKPAVEKMF